MNFDVVLAQANGHCKNFQNFQNFQNSSELSTFNIGEDIYLTLVLVNNYLPEIITHYLENESNNNELQALFKSEAVSSAVKK